MDALTSAKRIVIKIGSALLVEGDDLREDWLNALAKDIFDLRRNGAEVVVVSSGSIALGRGVLRLGGKSLPLEQSQAAASVGQIRLARAYEAALAPHGIAAAQILLTLDDSEDRRRYLNTRATLQTLLAMGAVPIVNENDTIATDEIRFGDNDRLAAQVAVTVGADLLVLLSDVDGLYTANPTEDPGAMRLETVKTITPQIEAMASDAGEGLSKGGMKTKLMAAQTATAAGCTMVICKGSAPAPLSALANGAPATVFEPEGDPQDARKAWINSMKAKGQITVDAGAARALKAGNSLLPAGVLAISGHFERGECVAIHGPDGRLGQGLSRYSVSEAHKIRGAQSRDIENRLGYPGRAALVHRDDMAV